MAKSKKARSSAGRQIASVCLILVIVFMTGGCIALLQVLWANGSPIPIDTEELSSLSGTSRPAEQTSQPTVVATSPKANISYLDDIVFVGDSITAGMASYGYLPKDQVYAFAGLNHVEAQTKAFVDLGNGRLLTIAQAVAKTKPDKIVFMMGINGAAWMNRTEFVEQYERTVLMIQKASPKTVIALQSILPVSKSQENSDNRITNGLLDYYNWQIREIAEKNGMYYLDSAAVFKQSNGTMKDGYHNGDGMHLSEKGYEALFDYILTHTFS